MPTHTFLLIFTLSTTPRILLVGFLLQAGLPAPQLTKHQQQEGRDTRTRRCPSRLHPHLLEISSPGACFAVSWVQMVTGLSCEPRTCPVVLLRLMESYSQREAVMQPMVHLLRQQRHRFYFRTRRALSMVRVSCFLKGGNFSLLPLFPTSPC